MNTKQRQLKFTLDHLESGETLTAVKARCIYGIESLSSRISELKKQGHKIESIEIGGGFVKYVLDDNQPLEREFFEFLKKEGVLDEYIKLNTASTMSGAIAGVFSLSRIDDPRRYSSSAFSWPPRDYNEWLRISASWTSLIINKLQHV
tara:strand:- start:208 stop:651 length:444 start_codon:yes stop_codon:yes gene_type:complete